MALASASRTARACTLFRGTSYTEFRRPPPGVSTVLKVNAFPRATLSVCSRYATKLATSLSFTEAWSLSSTLKLILPIHRTADNNRKISAFSASVRPMISIALSVSWNPTVSSIPSTEIQSLSFVYRNFVGGWIPNSSRRFDGAAFVNW